MKEGAAAGEGGIGEKAGAGAAAKLVKLPKLAKVHFNFSFSFSQFGTNAADIQLIETERLRGGETCETGCGQDAAIGMPVT